MCRPWALSLFQSRFQVNLPSRTLRVNGCLQIHDLKVSGSSWLDRFFKLNLTFSNLKLSLLLSLPLVHRQTIMTCCEDCDLTGIDVLVQQDIIDLVFSRVRLVDLARLTS